jgi:polyhydroxyalkanoate synthesis regulator phasin
MATRRRSGGRTRSGGTSAPDAVREQVRRLLNPVDAVLLTRERLQEVLDDAVERGRMTHDDATQLLAELVRRGRRQTDEVRRELESLIAAPATRVRREVDRARRATLGGSPISGYDDMTAAQVVEGLDGLSDAELRAVRDHERRNANRKTVLAAVERRLP